MPETGEPIALQEVVLRVGDTRARFLTYGLTLTHFEVGGANYVLNLPDHAYLDEHPCIGSIIGPVANRISGGRFTIDGKAYQVATNEGLNANHSGPDGFDRQVWEVLETSNAHAVFRHVMSHGHQGYPGPLTVTVTADVDRGTLTLTYEASSERATPVSLTHHIYARMPDMKSVDDLTLGIAASSTTATNAQKLPTDHAQTLELGDPLDFRTPRRIGDMAIDTSFNLGNNPSIDGLREAVALYEDETRFSVSTDLPAVQIYTGEALDVPRSGLAIEPQYPPDLVNSDGADTVILRPGRSYRHTIRYSVVAADENDGD